MLSVPLVLLLLADPSEQCAPIVIPTPCERALAEELVLNKDLCSARLRIKDVEIDELREAALNVPPPPEHNGLSLFNLPAWVTPVLGGILLGGGLALGLAL